MANKSDITFSLGLEIDRNTVNASMNKTEILLSSYKTKLEKSILKDFKNTVGGVSTNRLFGGNKNTHLMSMQDELSSLFKGINKSNTFTQMEKNLNKVADVFAKYETGFKTGQQHNQSRDAWLNKYSKNNITAFNKVYSKKEERKQASELKKRGKTAIDLLNVDENRNRVYLNLLKQRNDAKKKYDESGDIDALKKYTSADQQLKELEKEKKNNAKEEKGSLIRFGKMLGTLHLIKKVLGSIKDLWKRLSDTELKVTQRDVKEKGFFSVDAYSAMHANVDRSHAVISRGLGYMGSAAPFSMDAFDSVLQQLQDLNLKAISGQGIADDQLVISLQRLSDTLGMGFNIKDILTDPNLNLTDFLTNLMNSVEKFLPKLNSLDDIKKSLITNDIIKALGPELANALVYNYNYNQRTGGTSTVMEQVTSKGTNAYGLIDYTEEAKKFTDALASSRAALDEFKTALGGVFAPIGKVVLDKVEEKSAEGTMFINAIKSDNSGLNNVLLNTGSYALDKNQKKDKAELQDWYDKEENKKIAQEKFDDAKQLNSFNRILNFAFYNPTALKAGTSSVGLEEIAKKGKVAIIEEMINGKKFSQLDKGNFTDEEWTVIKDIYDNINIGGEDLAYQKDVVDIKNLKSFKKLFEQGEVYDFDPNKITPLLYLENMLGKKFYHAILIKLLSEENNFLQKAGIMKENGFGYYINDEYDKQGNKISGTVVLRLQLTDNTHRDIPTTFEEGMVNAIVNVPSLQTGK